MHVLSTVVLPAESRPITTAFRFTEPTLCMLPMAQAPPRLPSRRAIYAMTHALAEGTAVATTAAPCELLVVSGAVPRRGAVGPIDRSRSERCTVTA